MPLGVTQKYPKFFRFAFMPINIVHFFLLGVGIVWHLKNTRLHCIMIKNCFINQNVPNKLALMAAGGKIDK